MYARRQLIIVVFVFTWGISTAFAARQDAPVESRAAVNPTSNRTTEQAADSEPAPGLMYVLGFSLIGFAVVARRRRKPESGFE
jgi:hypothetical protein